MEIKTQKVRWMPVDGGEAGISADGVFIPWEKLEKEIIVKLLPQVQKLNQYKGKLKVIVKDLNEKKNWLIRIVDENNNEIGGIWFGPDPTKEGHPYDGLVRVGKSFIPPVIWNTFERHSDGSYRRVS